MLLSASPMTVVAAESQVTPDQEHSVPAEPSQPVRLVQWGPPVAL